MGFMFYITNNKNQQILTFSKELAKSSYLVGVFKMLISKACHLKTFGRKYSRMDQIKFVEESL